MQPRGLCTEFDHVVYVCDPQAGCIKLFSTMGECGKYFKAISNIYDAFSIHSKSERYSVKSLDDASKLVLSCKQYFNPIKPGGGLRGPDDQTHSCQSDTSCPMMPKLGDV